MQIPTPQPMGHSLDCSPVMRVDEETGEVHKYIQIAVMDITGVRFFFVPLENHMMFVNTILQAAKAANEMTPIIIPGTNDVINLNKNGHHDV